MKYKNIKLKKACFVLGFSFVLCSYLKHDYVYKPIYTIIEDEAYFATYSLGKIYIGNRKYINHLKGPFSKNDVFVIDERTEGDNPNMQIISSYSITDRNTRNEIIDIMQEYNIRYPSEWKRTTESLRLEWFVHNFLYGFDYKLDHTTDVDFDNNDEDKFNKPFINHL